VNFAQGRGDLSFGLTVISPSHLTAFRPLFCGTSRIYYPALGKGRSPWRTATAPTCRFPGAL
jgi:hypothetical protein